MNLKNIPETRILVILGIVVLTWHLLSLFSSFLGLFSEVALIVFLSWILAFILEPLVIYLARQGFHRVSAAAVIYSGLALLLVGLIWTVLPTTVSQLSQLVSTVPFYLPQNSLFSTQIENFLATTLTNSVSLASQIASGLTGLLLIFILSFYLLVSKEEISQTIKKLIPDNYEEDYDFLENVINNTFASFLRVQIFLGLILGLVTFLVLSILKIDYLLFTSVTAGALAMVPVLGGALFLIPAALAALTVSVEKMIIAVVVLTLVSQLIYNLVGPKLLGQALKIHPVIVLISFLIGYKIAGVWGAIFAIPVTSALTIVSKDLLKYWQQEADK